MRMKEEPPTSGEGKVKTRECSRRFGLVREIIDLEVSGRLRDEVKNCDSVDRFQRYPVGESSVEMRHILYKCHLECSRAENRRGEDIKRLNEGRATWARIEVGKRQQTYIENELPRNKTVDALRKALMDVRLASELRERERIREEERRQKIAAENKARVEQEEAERRRREEAEKAEQDLLESQRLEDAKRPVGLSTPTIPVDKSHSLPKDVAVQLSQIECMRELENAEVYQSYLQDPRTKGTRQEITMKTGVLRNSIANSRRQISVAFASIEAFRKRLVSLGHPIVKGKSEAEVEFLGVDESSVSVLHLYYQLTNVVLESAQLQMQTLFSSVWTYAHFISALWRQWPKCFRNVFSTKLLRKSFLLIPWMNEKSSQTVDVEHCRKLAYLFALRLAVQICAGEIDEVWTLVTRLLNRAWCKMQQITNIYLIEGALTVSSYHLSHAYRSQMVKIVKILQTHFIPGLLPCIQSVGSPQDLKVPFWRLQNRLQTLRESSCVCSPPEGYKLIAEEASLDDSL